jgi:hypothetical protein
METTKTHSGILQIIILGVLKFAYYFQFFINQLFWFFYYPYLFTLWKILGENKDNIKTIKFFRKNKTQSFFGKILKYIFIFHGKLNGQRHGFFSYDFLLQWNPAFPLIALKHKKTTWRITWLGNESQPGLYGLEADMPLTLSEKAGQFIIFQKYFSEEDPKKVIIECVWISGEHAGENFIIRKFDFEKSREHRPDIIYFPPRVVVLGLETIVFLAAAGALFSVIYHVYGFFSQSEFYIKIIKQMSFLWPL